MAASCPFSRSRDDLLAANGGGPEHPAEDQSGTMALPASLYNTGGFSPLLDGLLARSEPADSLFAKAKMSTLAQRFKQGGGNIMLAAPSEKPKIEMYSREFYTTCAIGGALSCGTTHTAVTPLDVVKCNMQIDHAKYKNISTGFKVTVNEGGMAGLVRGWGPTLVGYSIQGVGKFGLYEYFKKVYADAAGEETFHNNKTLIYLGASASAEFFADLGLCPLEAVKVKCQTSPGWAKGLTDGMPKFIAENGVGGLYRGIVPLWGRQIPYTMMKFACFESTVVALYDYVVPKPKSECNKLEQLEVSFAAGYIAGIFCAVVSHPADNMVSKLNNTKGATVGSVIAEMGWMNLFTRGLPLRILMVGTLTGLQWGIYDAYKVYAGLPTTGSAPPPAK